MEAGALFSLHTGMERSATASRCIFEAVTYDRPTAILHPRRVFV